MLKSKSSPKHRSVGMLAIVVLLIAALLLSPGTSSPVLSAISILLLAMQVPVWLFGNRLRTVWLSAGLGSLYFAVSAAREWAQSGSSSSRMFILFAVSTVAFAALAIEEAFRGLRLRRTEQTGPSS
jgi:hypothetical protein